MENIILKMDIILKGGPLISGALSPECHSIFDAVDLTLKLLMMLFRYLQRLQGIPHGHHCAVCSEAIGREARPG